MMASLAGVALIATTAPAAGQLTAGAGMADIALTPAMLPIDGFATVHDPLGVRVVVLRDGDSRAAIALLDQTSLGADVVAAVRDAVVRATAVPGADVLVIASHTFSAPHLFGGGHPGPGGPLPAAEQARTQAYRDAVLTAVDAAARRAAASIAPARLRVGQGVSDVNVNRNVQAADGWWLGSNAAGPSDKGLGIVRIDAADGHPMAVLMNYAVQSAVMDHSIGAAGKGVTSDLGGAAARHVEREYGGGTVALFLTGAAGDQAPAYAARRNLYDKNGRLRTDDLGDAGYALLDAQGRRLGEDVIRTIESATPDVAITPLTVLNGSVPLQAQVRPQDLQQIRPTRSYRFQRGETVAAPFAVLKLGDLAIVGVQAELSASTGQDIRRRSPFKHTLVVTMVNGAAKYMPAADSYEKITYEAMNSAYGPGSAETFAEHILTALRSLRQPPSR